jgi:hypothetical protein
VWDQLSKSFFRSPPTESTGRTQTPALVKRNVLPMPTEGEPIPAGQNAWISRPDNSIREVWTSPTRHHFVFRNPRDRTRFAAILHERDQLFANLPDRQPNGELLLRFNQLSRWFPRSIIWIVVGLIGLVLRRTRGGLTLVALAAAAMLVIVFNALGLFADPHFALPVAPAFVLFAAGAVLGPAGNR